MDDAAFASLKNLCGKANEVLWALCCAATALLLARHLDGLVVEREERVEERKTEEGKEVEEEESESSSSGSGGGGSGGGSGDLWLDGDDNSPGLRLVGPLLPVIVTYMFTHSLTPTP